MAFEYKKEYKEYYAPSKKPTIVQVPEMKFVAVRGKGNPNDKAGEYPKAMELLYGVSYTLKMSYKGEHKINGFFEYVVPPLEGFWWQNQVDGFNYNEKEAAHWISIIRLPDFITEEDFNWAIEEATNKKKKDFSKVEFIKYDEGLCVQCMHMGSFDNEPETVAMMNAYIEEQGYENDITDVRYHHEIYLSDPRKTATDKCKTIIRHPIKKCF